MATYQFAVDGHPLVVNPDLQLRAWNGASGTPTPDAPTNLRTTTSTSSTITLAWDAVAGAYELQRALVTSGVAGPFDTIYTGTNKSYQDGALTFQTTYAYRVRVTVGGVTSAYSAVRQFTTAGSNPSSADLYLQPYRATY